MLELGIAEGVLAAIMGLWFLAFGQVGVRGGGGIGALLGGGRAGGVSVGGTVNMGGAVTITRHTAAITALNTLTAVDQTLEGTTDALQFPSGVSRIIRIIIAAVHDYGSTQVSLITLTGIRLTGLGVGGGLHEFAGPGASVGGFGTSTGAFVAQMLVSHEVSIPITPGAKPTLQAAIAGDTAPGGTRIMVTLQFA